MKFAWQIGLEILFSDLKFSFQNSKQNRSVCYYNFSEGTKNWIFSHQNYEAFANIDRIFFYRDTFNTMHFNKYVSTKLWLWKCYMLDSKLCFLLKTVNPMIAKQVSSTLHNIYSIKEGSRMEHLLSSLQIGNLLT